MPTAIREKSSPGMISPQPGDTKEDALRLELERIAYATSHNLQARLRAIVAYCDEIKNAPGVKSKSVSPDTVQKLSHEADRLKGMMSAMVDYIQLETHPVTHSAVDCNEVMGVVCTMLADEIGSAGAHIEYANLPTVWGHYGRLTRLFAYLVENAIRFRSEQPCKIDITAVDAGQCWQFTVSDNGIGMSEEQTDMVFRLFKTLQVDDPHAGIGAGLALARKIIDSHDGRLWVESHPGRGSQFMFTLPKVK